MSRNYTVSTWLWSPFSSSDGSEFLSGECFPLVQRFCYMKQASWRILNKVIFLQFIAYFTIHRENDLLWILSLYGRPQNCTKKVLQQNDSDSDMTSDLFRTLVLLLTGCAVMGNCLASLGLSPPSVEWGWQSNNFNLIM